MTLFLSYLINGISLGSVYAIIALGYIAAFVLKLPVIAVYAIMFLDEIVKMPFVVKHFAARKWLKNITHEMN